MTLNPHLYNWGEGIPEDKQQRMHSNLNGLAFNLCKEPNLPLMDHSHILLL